MLKEPGAEPAAFPDVATAAPIAIKPQSPPAATESTPPKEAAAIAGAEDKLQAEQANDDRPALEREPYEWEQCTITVVLQFMPQGAGETRGVVISARDHLNTPLFEMTTAAALGALSAPIESVLERLRAELPARAAAYAKARAAEVDREAQRKRGNTVRNKSRAAMRKQSWDAVPDGAGATKKAPAPAKSFARPEPGPAEAQLALPEEETQDAQLALL